MTAAVLRIVHVIDSLDPARGGPPLIAWNLAAAQAARGHAVSLFAVDGADSTAYGSRPGLAVEPLPRPSKVEMLFGPGSVRRAVAAKLAGASILHLHGVWDPILRSAASAAREQSVPYLILLNGMLDPWSMAQSRRKKLIALQLGYRRMLNGASRLHLGNRDEEALIRPLGLTTKGAIIPNGVTAEALTATPEPARFRATVPGLGDRPYVLFLSRLHHKKGLDYLADGFAGIAAEYPDVRLVVAGPDDGERSAFEQRIAERRLTDRTHLVGPLYGALKWDALAGSACFCLPSRQEGFSMAILEALACRVPVVISEGCHFPEVGENGAGVVVPLDAAAVTAALRRVLSDPTAAAAMGSAGRRLVEARYTWDRVAEQCDGVYAEILGR